MTEKVIEIGVVGAEKLAEWKKEYGESRIQRLEVYLPDGSISVGYYKKPNRIHLAKAFSLTLSERQFEAGEYLLDACYLDGDLRQKSIEDIDTDIRAGAAIAMYQQTTVLGSDLKNA
jgi:hypothetical protein